MFYLKFICVFENLAFEVCLLVLKLFVYAIRLYIYKSVCHVFNCWFCLALSGVVVVVYLLLLQHFSNKVGKKMQLPLSML